MTTATDAPAVPEPHSLWDAAAPRLHVGTQRFLPTDEHLEFLAFAYPFGYIRAMLAVAAVRAGR